MTDDVQAKALATMRQAQKLIDDARRGSVLMDDTMERLGLDPAKVRAFGEKDLPPEGERMLAEQLARDEEDIERELSQARTPSAGIASRRPRGPLDLF